MSKPLCNRNDYDYIESLMREGRYDEARPLFYDKLALPTLVTFLQSNLELALRNEEVPLKHKRETLCAVAERTHAYDPSSDKDNAALIQLYKTTWETIVSLPDDVQLAMIQYFADKMQFKGQWQVALFGFDDVKAIYRMHEPIGPCIRIPSKHNGGHIN